MIAEPNESILPMISYVISVYMNRSGDMGGVLFYVM
jgi:hypothetical protein